MNNNKIFPEDEITTFDFTKEFDKNIKPLVKRIEAECLKLEMPVFMTFCIKSTPNETFYKNVLDNSPVAMQINLKTDTLSRHLGVCQGFEITPKKFQENMDNDFMDYELSDEDSENLE